MTRNVPVITRSAARPAAASHSSCRPHPSSSSSTTPTTSSARGDDIRGTTAMDGDVNEEETKPTDSTSSTAATTTKHCHERLYNNYFSGTPLENGCADSWTWDSAEKSHEVRLSGSSDNIAHFHPNWSNGTAAVRGDTPLNLGGGSVARRHYWEILIPQRIFGTSMMFGVGTGQARLHADAFTNLMGEDSHSWGVSHKGLAWHGGESRVFTKPFRENEPTLIGILLDWEQGTLTYFKDGENLGVAFRDLHPPQDVHLFPMVASTAAKTEMVLTRTRRDFQSLQDRCRAALIEGPVKHEADAWMLDCLPKRLRAYVAEGFRTYSVPTDHQS